jgi:hypothetical protein
VYHPATPLLALVEAERKAGRIGWMPDQVAEVGVVSETVIGKKRHDWLCKHFDAPVNKGSF